jgi:glucokinase
VHGDPDQVLLGDIGGTNARFAILADDRIGSIETLAVRDYPHFADSVLAFLSRHPETRAFARMFLACAGPIENGRCELTNSSWIVDAADLRASFNCAAVRVINDFEALAWSLPILESSDLFTIGIGGADRTASMAVLGPGTGLGVACHALSSAGEIVIASEGGHATLPATCRREDAIIEHLRNRFGHVSVERVLSGDGLVNLYEAIAAIDHLSAARRNAASITAGAIEGGCPICREALDLFCATLGSVAGDVALTFAAKGGVFIAGGIAPRIIEYLRDSQFRARFESKGRSKSYLANIATSVIVRPDPAFLGLKRLARMTPDP